MSAESPAVASWELALRLRERRLEAGIEVGSITKKLGFTRNYWSAVENERKTLSEESLRKLLDLLEFDEEERRELLSLRATAKERGWWSRYSGLLDSHVQRLFGLEAGAQSISGYESILIPGLLQTADYSRAMMTADVTIRPVDVNQRIEIRQRRQERLNGDDPLHLTSIISEASLLQQIGGPDVLRGQLQHLVTAIEEHPDNVEVRVIPFTATACGLFGAATVHVIDFANPRLPTVGWQETVTAWGIIDDPTLVRDIKMTYGAALERTLSARDSLSIIRQRIKEMG